MDRDGNSLSIPIFEEEEHAQFEDVLERSKKHKKMAYPSLFDHENDRVVIRAQLEQTRILEEANGKLKKKEATGASGTRTSSGPG